MEDEFLTRFHKEPSPEFSARLYERIGNPMQLDRPSLRSSLSRWTPVLVGFGAVLLLVLVLAYPPAQATAQGFLDLFRVRRFSAIAIDPARLDQIKATNIDFESLLSKNVNKVKDPGQPTTVADAAAASKAAGFAVQYPSSLPAGTTLRDIQVQGEGVVEITADTAKLQSLLDALQIRDVKVPVQLDGAMISVRKPPVVVMQFNTGRDPLSLLQGPSPSVALPEGVKLADLGEIALRVAGLSSSEAKSFAQNVNWNTTLLVPVPANAASFREVGVRNTTGLLITTGGTGGAPIRGADGARQHSLLLWSEGDTVFGLEGGPVGADLVTFANSLQ
jgi:hypothetical protein